MCILIEVEGVPVWVVPVSLVVDTVVIVVLIDGVNVSYITEGVAVGVAVDGVNVSVVT